MAPALTPRLSWTMMLVVFLLIAGGELYGAMQQLEWPLHLTGQVQLLVPRLASLAWELLYVYWFLARLTEADRGRRALELTRHGSTVRWLSVTMLRELPYAAAFAFGSGALAVLLRRLMSGEWGGAHAAAALVGSSLGLLQVLVDVVLVMTAVALLRWEHTAVLLLAGVALLGFLRLQLPTPFQNFGVALPPAVVPTILVLIALGAAMILILTMYGKRADVD